MLPNNIANGLFTTNPTKTKFYISSKVHKLNNTGCPVISSVDCHTSSISQYVDYHLQPIVKEVRSCIKQLFNNTKDVTLPKDPIAISLDVEALRISIPNSVGIAPVKRAYNKYQHKTVPTKVLTTFLALILTLKNFVFNSKFYLQIKGCTMDTICDPTYGNSYTC